MKEKLTQEKLKELFDYNPKTGDFTRKVSNSNRVKIGDIAGCLHHKGYLNISINGKTYQSHRLAFLYMEGYFPENGIDHIDRNKINNSWNNLREVSQSCNMRNQKININNKSGITGVCWHKGGKKLMAHIKIQKQKIHLGLFDNLTDAAKARWEAEVKYGFPNCNTTSSAYNYLKDNNLI